MGPIPYGGTDIGAALECAAKAFDGAAGEAAMATVFARALCEAGGWSLEKSARSAMRADLDYDGAVTLNELYIYVSRRVMWYLSLAGGEERYAQSVQVWPEGLAEVVFARRSG